MPSKCRMAYELQHELTGGVEVDHATRNERMKTSSLKTRMRTRTRIRMCKATACEKCLKRQMFVE